MDGAARRPIHDLSSLHKVTLRHTAQKKGLSMMGTLGPPHRQIHSLNSDRDQEIVNSVRLSMDATGYSALRQVQVYCEHGRVTLQGEVATYFLKQVAQTVVMSVDGTCDIDNDIWVRQ
jgi:osmotically-inducible protein OsmY